METFRVISLLVISALLLAACGAGAPAHEKITLKVGYVLWRGFYPLLIAKEKGFFAEHGVSLEPKPYGTLTEQHGGQISVESEPHKGSSFSVLLPLIPA